MESPKFIICPECCQRYNDTNKRRLIDTCGHPRCYSCLFKDKPCPVCSKLPHRLERARTLSNEKLLDSINGESSDKIRHQRFFSDTFTGMFRKDSYLRTLYSYDPGSKDYSMEEKIRKYKSLEGLNDRTRNGSTSSDLSSEVFISSHDASDQRSLGSSIDELNDRNLRSPTTPESPAKSQLNEICPKAWPSCPELSLQENIWQMRPNIERRKRPTSLYHIKYSNSSPRTSTYSPRSSGYWSELEQLSESESFGNSPSKHPLEVQSPSPLSKTFIAPTDDFRATKQQSRPQKENSLELRTIGNQTLPGLQKTKGILQQWRFKPNRTRSTECLRFDGDRHSKQLQRLNSMPVECHTKKVSQNNVHKKAYMTDV